MVMLTNCWMFLVERLPSYILTVLRYFLIVIKYLKNFKYCAKITLLKPALTLTMMSSWNTYYNGCCSTKLWNLLGCIFVIVYVFCFQICSCRCCSIWPGLLLCQRYQGLYRYVGFLTCSCICSHVQQLFL